MNGVLMLAHDGWMTYHMRHSVGQRAIFSASLNKETKHEKIDYLFCVAPGTTPRSIVAAGYISSRDTIHQDDAWAKYGPALGASTEAEWRDQAAKVLANSRASYGGKILAINLVDLQPYASPIAHSEVGLIDTKWQNLKIAGEDATRRLLSHLTSIPSPENDPRVDKVRERLAHTWNGGAPPTPDTLRRVQRILKVYERPHAITKFVKRSRGSDCQMCGAPGFRTKNGTLYCEVHHLFHLSMEPPADCLAPKYLVVLCATCHRRMHHCDVSVPEWGDDGWTVTVDEVEHRFLV